MILEISNYIKFISKNLKKVSPGKLIYTDILNLISKNIGFNSFKDLRFNFENPNIIYEKYIGILQSKNSDISSNLELSLKEYEKAIMYKPSPYVNEYNLLVNGQISNLENCNKDFNPSVSHDSSKSLDSIYPLKTEFAWLKDQFPNDLSHREAFNKAFNILDKIKISDHKIDNNRYPMYLYICCQIFYYSVFNRQLDENIEKETISRIQMLLGILRIQPDFVDYLKDKFKSGYLCDDDINKIEVDKFYFSYSDIVTDIFYGSYIFLTNKKENNLSNHTSFFDGIVQFVIEDANKLNIKLPNEVEEYHRKSCFKKNQPRIFRL